MLDGNTYASKLYGKRIDRLDHYESLFNSEMEEIIQGVEELTSQARSLVTHMEHEYGLDFSDQMKDALSDAVR